MKKLRPCLKCSVKFLTTVDWRICSPCKNAMSSSPDFRLEAGTRVAGGRRRWAKVRAAQKTEPKSAPALDWNNLLDIKENA